MKDINSRAGSFGHGWKVLTEEVTFALDLAPQYLQDPQEEGKAWANSADVCLDLNIEPGEVIDK